MNGQQAMERGLNQLEALRPSNSGRRLPNESRSKLQREAHDNLNRGMQELYGDNESTRSVARNLRRELKERNGQVDEDILRKLISQLENLNVEQAAADSKPDPEMVYVDPAKLPPAYRERIRKYFEILSEHR